MALNPYSKVDWQNAPSQATPVNATNLNKMDDQIYDITDHLINLNAGQLSYSNTTSELNGQTPQAAIDELAKPAFTEAGSRANIASGEKLATILGKIKKYFADLKTVAFSGSYTDLSNKPTIPTNTSQLVNDSNFLVDKGSVSVSRTATNYQTLLNALRDAVDWSKVSVNSKLAFDDMILTPSYDFGGTGYAFTTVYTIIQGSIQFSTIELHKIGNARYNHFQMFYSMDWALTWSDKSTDTFSGTRTVTLYY